MTVPVWHGDYDATRSAGSGSSVSITFAATPSDDELIVLVALMGDETEAEPVWPTGFTSLGDQESGGTVARNMWVAWKIADSEGSATYSITPDGGGNFPASNDASLAGTIITGVDLTNPIGPYFYLDNNTYSSGDHRIGPMDVGYTDTMTLAVAPVDGAGTPSTSEMDSAFTAVADVFMLWGYKTSTVAHVEPNVSVQNSRAMGHGFVTIRGTGSVADTGSYLSDFIAPYVDINFESDYTDGNTLASHTDWTAYAVSGTGVPTIDEHNVHKAGQVVDNSTAGANFCVLDRELSSDDHWAAVTFFADVKSDDDPNFLNSGGVFLRAQTGTAASTMDGYIVGLERELDGTGTWAVIYRCTDAGLTQLASSSDLETDFGSSRASPCRIHATIEGDDITGYIDGVSKVTYDISGDATKYTTGSYSGVVLERGAATADSQPFLDDFIAGDIPTSGISWVGVSSAWDTGTGDVSPTYPTGYVAVEDDFAVIWLAEKVADTGQYTVPTGWSKEATNLTEIGGYDGRLTCYTKKLTTNESLPTITGDTVDRFGSWCEIYRGVDTTTPIDVTSVTSSSGFSASTFTPTGLTTTTNGAVVISACGHGSGAALSMSTTQSFTDIFEESTYAGSNVALATAYKEIATAGAVTCPTWDESANSSKYFAITIALRPASGDATATPATISATATLPTATAEGNELGITEWDHTYTAAPSGSSTNTGSHAYTADREYLVYISQHRLDSTEPVTPTVTGFGGTTFSAETISGSNQYWDQSGGSRRKVHLFSGTPSSGGTGALAIGHSTAPADMTVIVYEISNSGGTVQVVGDYHSYTSGTLYETTDPATPDDTKNRWIAFVVTNVNTTTARMELDSDTGGDADWTTETLTNTGNAPTNTTFSGWLDENPNNDTTPGWINTTSSSVAYFLVVEMANAVVADATATPATITTTATVSLTEPAFDVEADITWHSLWYAGGSSMSGYSDTDDVTTWYNETAETNATETTDPPSYDASHSSYNNKPVIYFDGTEMLQAVAFTTAPTAPHTLVVIGNSDDVTPVSDFYFTDGGDLAGTNRLILADHSPKWGLYAGSAWLSSTADSDTDPHLFVATVDGSTGDDTLDIDGSNAVTGSAGSESITGLTIGARFSDLYQLKGNIALVAIYEGTLTNDANWDRFAVWVETHYGIEIAGVSPGGVSAGSTVTPSAIATTGTPLEPSASSGSDATATPDTILAAITIPAFSVEAGATVTSTVIDTTVLLPVPTITAGGSRAPPTIDAVFLGGTTAPSYTGTLQQGGGQPGVDIVLGDPGGTSPLHLYWTAQGGGNSPYYPYGTDDTTNFATMSSGMYGHRGDYGEDTGAETFVPRGTTDWSLGVAWGASGYNTSAPINDYEIGYIVSGSSSPVTLPTVTTDVDNCRIFYAIWLSVDGTTVTPTMSGLDFHGVYWNDGTDEIAALYSEVLVTAGTSTARDVSWTGGDNAGLDYLIVAVAPAPSPVAPTVSAGQTTAPSVISTDVSMIDGTGGPLGEPVTFVGSDSDFGVSANAVLTTPSGSTGDFLLLVGGAYEQTGDPDDPIITGLTATTTDFTELGVREWTTNVEESQIEAWYRIADGTEDSTYTIEIDNRDIYGTMGALVRLSECELQTTSGGVYTWVSTGSEEADIPAHTVDYDGSMAVIVAIGYEQAYTNSDFTGAGYTRQETQDSNLWVVYTKSVDAGSVGAVTDVQGGWDDGAILLLFIFKPTGSTLVQAGSTLTPSTITTTGHPLAATASGQQGEIVTPDQIDTTATPQVPAIGVGSTLAPSTITTTGHPNELTGGAGFTVTARDETDNGTTASATVSLSAFTPSNNSLVVAVLHGELDLAIGWKSLPASPITGGLTWTEELSYESDAAPKFSPSTADYPLNSGLFHAPVVTGSSITLTGDVTADSTNAFYSFLAVDITGHDVANPIVQSAKNETGEHNGSDSVSLAVTLSSTPLTGNLVVVGFGAGADSGGGFAAPTIGTKSMTQVYNNNNAYCQNGLWYRVIDGTETNAVITCTDLGQSVGNGTAFAIEVAAAGGVSAGSTVTPSAITTTGHPLVATASGETAGTATPDQIDITGTPQAPTAEAGQTTEPNTIDTTVTPQAPTTSAGSATAPGTIDVVTAGGPSSEVTDDFDSYTDPSTLDSQTDWDVHSISGTGVMSVDTHGDHKSTQVIDFSTTGEQLAVHQTALSSNDQYAEVVAFLDDPVQVGTKYNFIGPILRGSDASPDGSTWDGYAVILERNRDDEIYMRIVEFTNGTRTTLKSTSDLSAWYETTGSDNGTPDEASDHYHTVRGEIIGGWIYGYIDGSDEPAQRIVHNTSDDTNIHTTGSYSGVYGRRGEASTSSQPFFDDFDAGVMATSTQVTVSAGSTSTPGVIDITGHPLAATATGGTSDTATPDEILITGTPLAPTTGAGATLTPDTIQATVTLPVVGVVAGSTVTTTVIDTSVLLPVPTITAGGSRAPPTIDITGTPLAPTVYGGSTEAITDEIGISDSVALIRAITVTDAIGISDTTSPVKTIPVTVTDSIGISDSIDLVEDDAATVLDQIGVLDSIERIMTYARGPPGADQLGITDTVAAAKTAAVTATDPIGLTDTVDDVLSGALTESVTDAVGISDTVAAAKSVTVTVTDAVGIDDTIAPVKTATVVVTDALGILDSFVRVHAAVRTITDPIGIADSIDLVEDDAATVLDQIGILDTTVAAKTIAVAATDTVGISDSATAARTITVTVTDPIGTLDTVGTASTATRTVTDPVGLTDSVDTDLSGQLSQIVTDPVGLDDTVTAAKTIAVTVTDAVGILDTITAAKTVTVTVTDPIGIADTAAPVKTAEPAITDPVGLDDTPARTHAAARTATDPVGIADSIDLVEDDAATVLDQIGILDTVTPARAATRTVTDQLGILDTATAAKTITIAVTDQIGIDDTTGTAATAVRTITDQIGLDDTAVAAVAANRTVTDQIGITDLAPSAKTAPVVTADPIGLIDFPVIAGAPDAIDDLACGGNLPEQITLTWTSPESAFDDGFDLGFS